jgi:hypothetical protein
MTAAWEMPHWVLLTIGTIKPTKGLYVSVWQDTLGNRVVDSSPEMGVSKFQSFPIVSFSASCCIFTV